MYYAIIYCCPRCLNHGYLYLHLQSSSDPTPSCDRKIISSGRKVSLLVLCLMPLANLLCASLIDLFCQQAFTGSIVEHDDDDLSTIQPSAGNSLAKVRCFSSPPHHLLLNLALVLCKSTSISSLTTFFLNVLTAWYFCVFKAHVKIQDAERRAVSLDTTGRCIFGG
jgi:hypothetical protein